MKPFLNNGAKIELKPDPSWNWEGWDGVLEVQAVHNPMKISNKDIIHEKDVPMFMLLPGRVYKATGFSDIPGLINTALFTVDSQTLSDKIKVNGSYPLLISTTGKFTCNFTTPSFKATPGGPVPDPLAVKTGTWKVVDANQKVAFRNSSSTQGKRVVKLSGGKDGKWNKELNKHPLLPNTIYEVDGYIYETDAEGRVVKVSGKLELKERGRNVTQQRKSVELKDGTKGHDDGGHIIANIFNGPAEQINYVPMEAKSNRYGQWRQLEKKWQCELGKAPPSEVKVQISNIYEGNNERPVGFKIDYFINGQKFQKDIDND